MPNSHHRPILSVVLALSVTGCVNVPQPRSGGSDQQAVQILRQAAEAHGSAALQRVQDVNVRFEGKWNPFVARIQPVLVDGRFRGISEERFLLNEAAVGQTHVGPGGTKQVYRDKTTTRVWYNGHESNDAEVPVVTELSEDEMSLLIP